MPDKLIACITGEGAAAAGAAAGLSADHQRQQREKQREPPATVDLMVVRHFRDFSFGKQLPVHKQDWI